MSKNINVDLIGIPSGEVININTVYVQLLYNYGYILFNPDLCWTFNDEDEYKIKKLIENNKNISIY